MDEASLRALWSRTVGGDPAAEASIHTTFKPQSLSGNNTVAGGSFSGERTMTNVAPSAIAKGYEFLGEVGRGGMGIVYRARQNALRREVAVKRVLAKGDAGVRNKFVSESLVTAGLDHPNIVPVHDLSALPDGDVFLAMKLVGGTSWKDLLHPETDEHRERAAKYDREAHLGILLSVCNALAFAHSKNIVHRDLKPENVMVGEFGEVLVMDWGIAIDVRATPDASMIAPHRSTVRAPSGTPSYMAPELAEGRGADQGPWTDIYLLGAILHEVVTGSPPHQGKTVLAVLGSASKSDPPVFPGDVPQELQELIRKAMAREPSRRHASVKDFQAAVSSYLAHRESLKISDAAQRTLAGCQSGAHGDRNRLYAEFADAIAGMRQARVLWAENPVALAGEKRARVAFAEAALAAGDLGLAAAQAQALGDAALGKKVEDAQAARDGAERAAKRNRQLLLVGLVVIALGLATGVVLVNAARQESEKQRERADTEAALAKTNEAEARKQSDLAQKNEAEARKQSELAQKNEAEAKRQGEAAAKARDAEASQRKAAESALETSKLEAARALYDRSFGYALDGNLQAANVLRLRAIEVAPPHEKGTFEEPGWAADAWTALRWGETACPREVARLALGGKAHAIAVTAKLAAVALDDRVELFDASKPARPTQKVPIARATELAIGGSTLVAVTPKAVVSWNLETDKVEREHALGDGESVLHLAPSARFALISGKQNDDNAFPIFLLDLAKGARTGTASTGVGGDTCGLDPTGTLVASGDAGAGAEYKVEVRDAKTGRLVRELKKGHDWDVTDYAWTPDGKVLVTGGWDGRVVAWDLSVEGQVLEAARTARSLDASFGGGGRVVRLRLSRDGRVGVASLDDGSIVAVSIPSLALIARYLGKPTLDARGGTVDPDNRVHDANVFAIDPDARTAWFGLADGTVRVVDISAGARARERIAGTPSCVAFSPGGSWVAVGCVDGSATLHEARTLQVVRRLPALPGEDKLVRAISVSRDGQRVLVLRADEALVWGKEAFKLPHPDGTGLVGAGAISEDGKRALVSFTAGKYDIRPRLFDLEKRAELRVYPEPSPEKGEFCYGLWLPLADPKKFLAWVGNEHHVRVVDLDPGKEVERYEGRSLALSADGKWAAAPGKQGRGIAIWDRAAKKEWRRIDDRELSTIHAFGDARTVVSFGNASLRVFDFVSGRELRRIAFSGVGGAVTSDGAQAVTVDPSGITLWQLLGSAPPLPPADLSPWRKPLGVTIVATGVDKGAVRIGDE